MPDFIYNGFLNILKPSGPTSSDIVVRVRRLLNGVKTGHLGTLDPLAAGVLPIAVGKATKLFDYLAFKTKKYRAIFSFGVETETGDSDGKIVKREEVKVEYEDLKKVLPCFLGKTIQIPHRYSALKIGGAKACDLARKGETFDLKGREVFIYNLNIVGHMGNNYTFDIECSGGTYIRSLCRDIATQLGTVATMTMLIRLGSGAFNIENAVPLEVLEDSLKKEFLMFPLTYPLDDLVKVYAEYDFFKSLNNGADIPYDTEDTDNVLVYCRNELFGIGDIKNKRLKVRVNLRC